MKRLCLAAALLVLLACKKETAPEKTAPAIVSATPSMTAAATASPDAAPVKTSIAWTGTYSLTPGTISIPESKDYAGVKQAKDDPSKMMGDGKLDMEVDPNGKVSGSVDGPAGPAIIDGAFIEGEIRGTLRRKDPKDDGLTGTLSVLMAGDRGEGSMSLSEANAAIVRTGKVSLKKK